MQIRIDSIHELNKEISWMIGIWIGDNWSSKEGTVIRNKKRSSGRFGICNNDEENIQRFLEGLKNQFKIEKIKLDVQIPRHIQFNKDAVRKDAANRFGIDTKHINVYHSSPWRQKTGYAVYTNNTALLRFVNGSIYKKIMSFIRTNRVKIKCLLQGIVDGEGDVDKANKLVGITNKDQYVIEIIQTCLRNLEIPFRTRLDGRQRTYFQIKDIKKFHKRIGFNTKRKQQALEEMLGGNFCRSKDLEYLEDFRPYLKKGISARELHEKTKIPHPTVRLVLKNLSSNGSINKEMQKSGRTKYYVYRLSTRLLN